MRVDCGRTWMIGLLVPLAVMVMHATPCFAQFTGAMAGGATGAGNPGSPMSAQRHGVTGGDSKAVSAPPVLPGTKGPSVAAEPTQSPSDMSPTDALFDAINRGDVATARDAVNRGANLNAYNLLGMTPVDMSVDLGRNDITFMLLSMRGDDAGVRRAAAAASAATARAPIASGRPAPARAKVVALGADDGDSKLPAVATPRLYSGNGGSPIPAAGFLGFDNNRSFR